MQEPDLKFTLDHFSHQNRDAVRAFVEGAKNEANQHDVLLAIEQAISRVLESINGEEYTVYVDIGPALQELVEEYVPDTESEEV